MRFSPLLIGAATSLSFFVSITAVPTPALAQTAQVSDADRKAARDLFFQGVELQNAGKFADALDKFQRAQSVINAPTNLLHIAECQAAMGKLVEAAETYRAVTRFALPPNPPPPFVAAQSQAAAELAQLEPRIPELTVEVTPANIPTLQLTIDDQQVPNALVGVGRPINPGQHKIVAQAPGYSREEKTVDVKEKSRQKVPLELKSTGAVTYGPAGLAGGATTQPTAQSPQPPPTTPDKPPPYADPAKQPEPRSRTSILLGLRLGGIVPTGEVALNDGSTSKFGNYSSAGAAIGLEGMFRFVRVLYIGGLLQAEGYGEGSATKVGDRTSSGGIAALTGGWISNPDGFGVIMNLGVGYRWYGLERSVAIIGTTQKVREEASGGAFQLGFGLHIKTGKVFRLVPKVEIDFASLTNTSPNVGAPEAKVNPRYIFIGLAGDFDINLDKSGK